MLTNTDILSLNADVCKGNSIIRLNPAAAFKMPIIFMIDSAAGVLGYY